MTTAQPGQEQRMVTDAMLSAGNVAAKGFLANSELEAIYAAMEAARPTADLGDDGELVERLRAWPAAELGNDALSAGFVARLMKQAADRLILCREALGDAFGTLHYIYETTDDDHEKRAAAEARDKIDAVLSRSGG